MKQKSVKTSRSYLEINDVENMVVKPSLWLSIFVSKPIPPLKLIRLGILKKYFENSGVLI